MSYAHDYQLGNGLQEYTYISVSTLSTSFEVGQVLKDAPSHQRYTFGCGEMGLRNTIMTNMTVKMEQQSRHLMLKLSSVHDALVLGNTTLQHKVYHR